MRTLKMRARRGQAGFSLMELLIALTMLTIGMAGIAILVTSAMVTDYRNRNDTTSTMLAQRVLSRVAGVSVNSTSLPTVTDCLPQTWTIATTPGGATLVSSYGAPNLIGDIDWTQSYSSIANNYKMQYRTCSGTTYEVRWNIAAVSGTTGPFANQVAVSARPMSAANVSPQFKQLQYGKPVTLRTIVGQ